MHLCTECAFKHGKIDDKRYLRECGIHLDSYHAAVYEGEIVMWTGKKPPWEKTDRDFIGCLHCGNYIILHFE